MTFDFDDPPERVGTGSYKWQTFGPEVLPLWVADMDFAAPPPVVAAVRERAAHGVYGYSVVSPALQEAIADHLSTRYGWPIEAEWLLLLPGVVPALNLVCRAFAAAGQGVMTVTPVYPPFLKAPVYQGRALVGVPAALRDGRWRLPLAEMEAAVTEQTKVLLFCHPHNPLGRAWDAGEVAAVVEFCRRHGLVLCSDEIHCDLLLDAGRHLPSALAAEGADRLTVTLMSPSKTFNLPGLNFAFAVVPGGELRGRLKAAAAGLLPMPSPFALVAAEAAYREGDEWLAALLSYLRENAALVERFVADELPGVTTTHVEATYLAWLDATNLGLADPAQACVQAGVALSDGAAFGAPGWLRLNFGCPRAVLREGLARVKAALA
jgi:cysteine-S-conjugate beta-lyase